MKENFYLGIDVGGTKINAILLDKKTNNYFSAFHLKTPKNKSLFLRQLTKEIEFLIKNKKISGLAFALPGIVDDKKGILVKAPNLPFLNNFNIKKFFSKFSKKIKVDNDSRCFLRAEACLGAGKNFKNIIVLAIGTGIGGGIMINGEIYYGSHNGAGEFGHMIINNDKTLEELGSKRSSLRKIRRERVIGIGIANLINLFDPDVVILGGGAIFDKKIRTNFIIKAARKYIMSPLGRNTLIVVGKLGKDSQAIGAALLLK